MGAGGFRLVGNAAGGQGVVPVRQQLILQGEHFAFVVGGDVIVAKQVQHAVHGQQG